MFQVITTDALVTSDAWRKMVQIAVNRSFNQITVWSINALILFHINAYRHIRNLIPYLRILHSSGDPVLSTIYLWQSCLFM